jgi:hypothetical protein
MDSARDRTSILAHGPSAEEWAHAHAQLKADNGLWQALAFAYLQNAGTEGLIEYRHCPACTSTIGRKITPGEATELLSKQEELLNSSRSELAAAMPRRAA